GTDRGLLYYSDGTNPNPPSPPAANTGPSSVIAQVQFMSSDPVVCSAEPTPGATTGPSSICADDPFTLGITNESLEQGLTYQWETSTDGTTWTNAPGASTGLTYSTSQTESTWYRLQVTCAGNGTAASTPIEVGMTATAIC